MRINLPCDTPANIVQHIRAVAHAEQLFNAYFPRIVSVSLRNPVGIVHVSGNGSGSIAAQQYYAWTVAKMRESGLVK